LLLVPLLALHGTARQAAHVAAGRVKGPVSTLWLARRRRSARPNTANRGPLRPHPAPHAPLGVGARGAAALAGPWRAPRQALAADGRHLRQQRQGGRAGWGRRPRPAPAAPCRVHVLMAHLENPTAQHGT
jgi:hypothetical protein